MPRKDIERFYALKIDFAALGLAPWSRCDVRYFCTPADAECFASTGVDGVHYCLLPGEETVYVVRPACGEEGRYVLPAAENFREFLSFLLYCGNEAAIEQIACMDEPAFRSCLTENAPCREALAVVAETFGLTPRDPFAKVKALQAAFDPEKLHFSDEYYETLGLENPRGGSPEEYHPAFETQVWFKTEKEE